MTRVVLRERVPPQDPLLDLLYGPRGGDILPGGHFRGEAGARRRLAHLDAAPGDFPRLEPRQAQALLKSENAFAPLHPAQELSLDLAGKHGTLFLLTGQQPGLLGGPVLWLWKALTCAALAEESTRRLGRPVLPIFWVAGDDADLHECNHLELLEDLPPGFPSVHSLPFADPARALPVGSRPIPAAAMEELLGRLAGLWGPATVDALRAIRPGSGSLAAVFLRLAQAHLGSRGVLFLDGNSPVLRSAARPVLARAVTGWTRWQAALERGTAALAAAGLEAPVTLRQGMVHAFALRDGERHRLFAERTGGPAPEATALGGPGSEDPAPGSRDKLHFADSPHVDRRPDLASLELTHDVFSRPLVADSLLPVLGHVLGPAELRYFAQLAPVFLEETGDMPLVHPRMAAAVLPSGEAAALAAEGVPLAEAARLKPSDLRGRLADKAWKAHPAAVDLPAEPPRELLDGLERSHLRHFRDTGPLRRLEKALQGSWRRYLRSLGRLALAAAPPRADLFRALRRLANGAGQDRHLNFFSLLDALGPRGVEDLIAAAEPAEPGLRLFTWTPQESP